MPKKKRDKRKKQKNKKEKPPARLSRSGIPRPARHLLRHAGSAVSIASQQHQSAAAFYELIVLDFSAGRKHFMCARVKMRTSLFSNCALTDFRAFLLTTTPPALLQRSSNRSGTARVMPILRLIFSPPRIRYGLKGFPGSACVEQPGQVRRLITRTRAQFGCSLHRLRDRRPVCLPQPRSSTLLTLQNPPNIRPGHPSVTLGFALGPCL